MAYRLTAYMGVMAARQEEEQEGQPARRTTPTRTSSTAAPTGGSSEKTEVSLTAFRAKFPGLVSMGQGG